MTIGYNRALHSECILGTDGQRNSFFERDLADPEFWGVIYGAGKGSSND